MSESLRRLVNLGSFNTLQDKLEDWYDSYHLNTCDENVSRGCEIIELNSKIQGHLFKLLNVCAAEGGIYGGAGVLKTRLLPLLEKGFMSSGLGGESNSSAIADLSTSKSTREIKRLYEKSLDDLEFRMKQTRHENETLRLELDETKQELERQGRQSVSDKMFDKKEITVLKSEVDNLRSQNDRLKHKAKSTEQQFEREIDHLKEDVAVLTCRSPSPCHVLDCHDHLHPHGHHHHGHHHHHGYHHHHGHLHDCLHPHDCHCTLLNCHAKEHNLISKFNELFSIYRVDAMNTLKRYGDDHDNNQKIVFYAAIESFNAARTAFRSYKSRVRTSKIGKTPSHMTLEECVQDHIDSHGCHEADVTALAKEVVRSLEFKIPLIRRPNSGLGFDVINSFIREVCQVAWSMLCLPTPVDVYHPASSGEFYDDSKYRRSYDSDYTASFITHHIWPCLVKSGLVIAKGEAITKRSGAKSNHGSPRRSPTRSTGRSISPSPRRSSPVSTYRARSPTFKGMKKF